MSCTGFVNVLTLGVKNDGSEDISVIVNEATKEHALFFPCGLYKVSAPLNIRHSIRGEGYSRHRSISNNHTWLVSDIENEDCSTGIVNIEADCPINVENISLQCNSQECGLRLASCTQKNMVFIDRIGIFNVKGYGVYEKGRASRALFLQNVTIWGAKDHPVPCVGIFTNTGDNRLSNIEIMGCRIGIWMENNIAYGDNLHIWTGSMAQKDNNSWWRGTRAILLDNGAVLNATNVYPDTAFYCIECRNERNTCNISNIFYYEDYSAAGSMDYDGKFFNGVPGSVLKIFGGEICLPDKNEKNGRLESVYIPGINVSGVILKTNVPSCAEKLHCLVLDDTLPDYQVEYAQQGWCKLAEIVTAQNTGYVEGRISCDNGANYEVKCYQKDGGALESRFISTNPLCEETPPLAVRQLNDTVYGIYFRKNNDSPEQFRFTASAMQPNFRPLHFGVLKNLDKTSRCCEVLEKL